MPVLHRDGVALHFEQAGGSGPPVVLIHGWCCDHTYFAPQAAHFAARGQSVVAPDLRGHGRSDKPESDYPIGLFSDDVAWMCRELRLCKPILVGHSMGGIVAYDIASRHRDLPGAIVMVDSAVVPPAAVRAGMLAFVARLGGKDYVEVMASALDATFFLPTDDAVRKRAIISGMAAAPQHVMVAAYQGLIDYDAFRYEGALSCPALFIQADEPAPRADLARLLALMPGLQHGRTVGSGHFCQLEVPDQVNAMIDRFLALSIAVARPSSL